jgi:hypothetical protein
MQTFTDNGGRDWQVKVNPITLGKIEQTTGESFSADPEDGEGPIVRIATDCMYAFQVLWVLCEAQANERGVSSEDFGDALVGDVLGKAQAALCEAIADFYPDPARREAVRRVFSVIKAAEAKLLAKASKQLDDLDVDQLVEDVTNGG